MNAPAITATAWAASTGLARDADGDPPRVARVAPRPWRRLDPLARLAVAVIDGLAARRGVDLAGDTALVCATGYGSIESTLRFLHSIKDFGDAGASPTPFTSSVHNASAGSLGEIFDLHGPCTTLSHGDASATAALRQAALWLAAGRATRALVVVGDRHIAFSRMVVTALRPKPPRTAMAPPWPVADGVAAVLLETGAPAISGARAFSLGPIDGALCIDGGWQSPAVGARIAKACGDAPRITAPTVVGGWWPGCVLAGLPWDTVPGPLRLVEGERRQLSSVWFGARHVGG